MASATEPKRDGPESGKRTDSGSSDRFIFSVAMNRRLIRSPWEIRPLHKRICSAKPLSVPTSGPQLATS